MLTISFLSALLPTPFLNSTPPHTTHCTLTVEEVHLNKGERKLLCALATNCANTLSGHYGTASLSQLRIGAAHKWSKNESVTAGFRRYLAHATQAFGRLDCI